MKEMAELGASGGACASASRWFSRVRLPRGAALLEAQRESLTLAAEIRRTKRESDLSSVATAAGLRAVSGLPSLKLETARSAGHGRRASRVLG